MAWSFSKISNYHSNITMGQQIRKVTKRRRRADYLKRKKEQAKLNSNTPIRLATPVAKEAKPAAKEVPAK
ncbi:hypothetical protein F2A26_15410, partial [Alistipes finegoldii]